MKGYTTAVDPRIDEAPEQSQSLHPGGPTPQDVMTCDAGRGRGRTGSRHPTGIDAERSIPRSRPLGLPHPHAGACTIDSRRAARLTATHGAEARHLNR
jgi:hypothetical protein